MQAQAEAELADPNLPTPCRKVLSSLQEHWEGLTRFLDDPRIPLDNNASERRVRGPALGRKNYYGSGRVVERAAGGDAVFPVGHLEHGRDQHPHLADVDYLKSCAENGGRAPSDISPFLPWTMSVEKRRDLAIDPDDSS